MWGFHAAGTTLVYPITKLQGVKARAGADVGVNYSRSRDEAEDTARQIETLGGRSGVYRVDVADDDQVRAMVFDAPERGYHNNIDLSETDEKLAHTRRVNNHRGPRLCPA